MPLSVRDVLGCRRDSVFAPCTGATVRHHWRHGGAAREMADYALHAVGVPRSTRDDGAAQPRTEALVCVAVAVVCGVAESDLRERILDVSAAEMVDIVNIVGMAMSSRRPDTSCVYDTWKHTTDASNPSASLTAIQRGYLVQAVCRSFPGWVPRHSSSSMHLNHVEGALRAPGDADWTLVLHHDKFNESTWVLPALSFRSPIVPPLCDQNTTETHSAAATTAATAASTAVESAS